MNVLLVALRLAAEEAKRDKKHCIDIDPDMVLEIVNGVNALNDSMNALTDVVYRMLVASVDTTEGYHKVSSKAWTALCAEWSK